MTVLMKSLVEGVENGKKFETNDKGLILEIAEVLEVREIKYQIKFKGFMYSINKLT
jgi:hypothetical protein